MQGSRTLLSSGSALKAAGGSSFEQAVKDVADKQSLSVGECKFVVIVSSSKQTAAVTLILLLTLAAIGGAGALLPCKHVIHVHSPSWNSSDAVPNLEKAVKNCLTLAENKNLSTVAFPSIASGQ